MSAKPCLHQLENFLNASSLAALNFPSKFEEHPDAGVSGESALNANVSGLSSEIEMRAGPEDLRRQVDEELSTWHSRNPRLRGFEPTRNTIERQHESRVSSEVFSRQFRDLPSILVSRRILIRSVVIPPVATGTRPTSRRASNTRTGRVPHISRRHPAAHVFRARLVKIGRSVQRLAHIRVDKADPRKFSQPGRAPLHLLNQIHFVSPSLPGITMREQGGAVILKLAGIFQ